MKKIIFILMLLAGFCIGASAQSRYHHRWHSYHRTHWHPYHHYYHRHYHHVRTGIHATIKL